MKKRVKYFLAGLIVVLLVPSTPALAARKETTFKKKKTPAVSSVRLGLFSQHPPEWWYKYHYKNWKASHDELLFQLTANRPVRQRLYENTLQNLYGMQLFLPDGIKEGLDVHIDGVEKMKRDVLNPIMTSGNMSKVRIRLEKIYRGVHRDYSYTNFNSGIFIVPAEYQAALKAGETSDTHTESP